MYVHLDTNLFDDKGSFRKLDRIIPFFEDDKHTWIINTDEEVDSILESEWLNSHAKRIQPIIAKFIEEAFHDLINISSNERKKRKIIKIQQSEEVGVIPLSFAIDYLNEPLYILVENEFSDAAFLNALFRNFEKKAKKIREAKSSVWLDYYHAGGKEMIVKIIDERYKRTPLPIRLFVLIDSDKKSLDDVVESTERLKEKCDKFSVPFHILHKREIENYIPDKALYKTPKVLHPVTDELLSLDKDLQDFYDFKNGISNKERKEGIFSELSNENYNVLKLGYERQKNSPQKSLYLLFNDECVTRENLMAKCKHQENPNELNDILDKITSLL